jgi:hypothetical protein
MHEPTNQVELVFITPIMKPHGNTMLQEQSTTKPMNMDMFKISVEQCCIPFEF